MNLSTLAGGSQKKKCWLSSISVRFHKKSVVARDGVKKAFGSDMFLIVLLGCLHIPKVSKLYTKHIPKNQLRKDRIARRWWRAHTHTKDRIMPKDYQN